MFIDDSLVRSAVLEFRYAVSVVLEHCTHGCPTAIVAAGRAAAFAEMLAAVGVTDAEVWGDYLPGLVADAASRAGADPTEQINALSGVRRDAAPRDLTVTRAVPADPAITSAEVDAFDPDVFISTVLDQATGGQA